MWFKLIFTFSVLCCYIEAFENCDGSSMNVDGFVPRIHKNKAGLGEFPWTVALYKKDSAKPHCAGSIIDESTVITTAFCVKK